ncbi:unknown protein [Microcystis aeruginosa NIES-843]|uniref:Uncharacterized protein n=1 Tax=Microcystis aeruginosa (strain NIES-843 / IAM M-2473) TaxID=449447 RepID=B0JJB2_MICAN|nr:unknown protein [Microcystis aeruginosa NIES-843]
MRTGNAIVEIPHSPISPFPHFPTSLLPHFPTPLKQDLVLVVTAATQFFLVFAMLIVNNL